MKTEKIRQFAYITVASLGITALIYIFMKYLLAPILPFLVAWAIAFAVDRPAGAISAWLSVKKRRVRAALALLVTAVALAVAALLVWLLARELWSFLVGLGEGEALGELIGKFLGGGLLSELFGELGERVAEAFYGVLSAFLTRLGGLLTSFVGAVPRGFLFVVITVVSSVFFALDLEKINGFVRGHAPKKIYSWLSRFKAGFFDFGIRYLRSYLMLMLITFLIMLLGLVILGARYAALLALVIAVLDLLPVIGVGTVLVPWSIFSLCLGDMKMGIGLIVLLVLHELARQVAEPKILGKNLGVHPLVTLILLYLGYSIFGLLGLLLVPVFTVILDVTLGKKNTAEVAERPVAKGNDGK